MQCARILLVTAAPGVDAATLLRTVEERGVPGASFHACEATGVSSSHLMARDYESAAAGMATTIDRWVACLARREGLCVLEGHVLPSTARDAFARHHVDGHILVVDGAHADSDAPLAMGELLSLPSADRARWATDLRTEARALELPVLDLSPRDIGAAVDALHAHIATLAAV